MNLPPETLSEVKSAILSLLRAGWNTEKIASQLHKPGSYGPQGVTYAGAKELADEICRAENSQTARQNAVLRSAMRRIQNSIARKVCQSHGLPQTYARKF